MVNVLPFRLLSSPNLKILLDSAEKVMFYHSSSPTSGAWMVTSDVRAESPLSLVRSLGKQIRKGI